MTAMDQWYVFGWVFIGMLAVLAVIEYLDWRDRRRLRNELERKSTSTITKDT